MSRGVTIVKIDVRWGSFEVIRGCSGFTGEVMKITLDFVTPAFNK